MTTDHECTREVRRTSAPGFRRRFVRTSVFAVPVLCLAVGIWSAAAGGLVFDLICSDQDAAWKLARLQRFFEDCGPFAPVVYFLFVTVEVVVAPIPGLMLYAPGGIVFGGFAGGAIALAGNVVGAGIACQAVRYFGGSWLSRFVPNEKPGRIQETLERRGVWLIFLLRLNPLTSSDLVSYVAGLTRIPVWKVMLATLCGMAPLCFAQAYLAENLLEAFPGLIYSLIVLCAVYVLVVARVVRRLVSGERSEEHTTQSIGVSSATGVSGDAAESSTA